mgnify:CR=1 FL=1
MFGGPPPTDVLIERPRNPDHGDYATNVALRPRQVRRLTPRDIAEADCHAPARGARHWSVDVAGPGFPQHPAVDERD